MIGSPWTHGKTAYDWLRKSLSINSVKVPGVATHQFISTLCNKLHLTIQDYFHPSSRMNILYIALFLCMVWHALASKDVSVLGKRKTPDLETVNDEGAIASSTKAQRFRKAVERGDFVAAWNVFDCDNDKLKECCGKYLVSLGRSGLVELVKGAGFRKYWILRVISMYADQPLIDEVFAEIKPTNELLCDFAHFTDVACKADRFIYLLRRITIKRDQECAVRNGVVSLFIGNKTEYFDPLLFALQDETSLDPDLTNVAIHEAFRSSSFYPDDRALLVTRFFDHSSITAKDYSLVLYRSYNRYKPKHELFYWLLARADLQDLEEVERDDEFSSRPSEFQAAINHAWSIVSLDARIGKRYRERVAALKEALDGHVIKVLLNLITDYVGWKLNLF